MSKQKNTLFNYFAKSPPGVTTPSRNTSALASSPSVASPSSNSTTTPRRSALTPSNNGTPKLKVKRGLAQTPLPIKEGYEIGSLLWSKLDGFPWWPSLICLHPVKQVEKEGGKVHVQFFDKPPTRAWIHMKFARPYKGSHNFDSLGVSKPKDATWDEACREADAALEMSVEERLKLVVELLPSDEENSMSETSMNTITPQQTPQTAGKRGKKGEGPKPKRRRILSHVDSNDDSEEEYKPEVIASSESEIEDSLIEEDKEEPMEECEVEESPVNKRKRKAPGSNKTVLSTPSNLKSFNFDSPSISNSTKKKLSDFSCRDADGAVCDSQSEGRRFSHLSYDFLKPEQLRDGQRRRPDDPNYDPRTLYIPDSFKQSLTPAMRQWWEMKTKNFDVILFFKVGKFYELYHTDALLAVKELGIILMKGDHAHCGFPERVFSKYSSQLIERGYKVARVEQTETPEMMTERCKKMSRPTKFDRVVEREVCQITSRGTRTYNAIEGDNWTVEHHFLMAVWEKSGSEATGGKVEFGVCFVDTSIGNFHLGQFEDDRYRSRLSTLLTRYNPVEIISAKRGVSTDTTQAWNSACPAALHELLSPNADCWDSSKTLRALAESDFFKVEGELDWPEGIRPLLDESSSLGLAAKEDSEMAIRALGALHWYLKECKLEQELFSRRSFEIYHPIDEGKQADAIFGTHMILDGMTLRNLDVLVNSSTGTTLGTLLERLNRCNTAFGQRTLRHWLCAPLCQQEAIDERLDAVEYLMNNLSTMEEVGKILKSLPDLERLVNKIHSQGSSLKAKNHPDSRAVFFDGHIYSKKKITDFLLTLEGFRSAQKVEEYFRDTNITSKLLRQSVKLKEYGGEFPDMEKELEFFRKAFDHQQAAKEGTMIPRPGVDKQYDQALERIAQVQAEAEKYLQEQKRHFNGKVSYVGADKKRFQLEVAEGPASRADHSYELQGQRKGFKRYYTAESRGFLQQMLAAEDQRNSALKDISRRIFEQFDKHNILWEKTIKCLAVLDVLMALAAFGADQKVCRPRIVSPGGNQRPFLRMVQGRHPAHSQLFANSEFIPNDVSIGSSSSDESQTPAAADHSLTLVTGPNMGGKSTLMRQVGLCVLLAQMGSFVPAEEFELTPVDRLFTRLGANDHILGGESTFFVELSETAAILKHATHHSLVLLDELGRGTATFDGTAIAYSVVDHLAIRQCRTLFSTHYHSLVHDLSSHSQVRLGHMACMVENDEQVDDPSQENIIFLYQFVDGACPKSYGFHAARLAGLDQSIISRGFEKAKLLERKMLSIQLFRDLLKQQSPPSDFQPNWGCLA